MSWEVNVVVGVLNCFRCIKENMLVEVGKGMSPNFQEVLEALLVRGEFLAFAPDTEETRMMINLMSIKFPLLQVPIEHLFVILQVKNIFVPSKQGCTLKMWVYLCMCALYFYTFLYDIHQRFHVVWSMDYGEGLDSLCCCCCCYCYRCCRRLCLWLGPLWPRDSWIWFCNFSKFLWSTKMNSSWKHI